MAIRLRARRLPREPPSNPLTRFLSFIMAPSKNISKPPSKSTYRLLVATFLAYSIFLGWYVSTRPKGKWKSPFSWHPFLMTLGMTGSMGIAAITKKLGGYTNTKLHGMIASLGFFLSLGGLYAIYHNKNLYERPHFTSVHGKIGIAVVVGMVGPLLAGAVVLHPDFGIDKTNQTIRKIHKVFSRILMAVAWGNSLYGLYGMRSEHPMELIAYGLPLAILMPLTLL
uniref:Cytochrome b561 domain-containing protein n=1 Tax=Pseudo-nitzschia australis TaxID=44445 RepID=A0A7S4AE99_9STRA|mmetsp:Transcript_24715/g.54212  ORF Transcript_24715/g.54212 Transcript_24715/m.54212 type:complete len:225 (+) Transcript_24715:167-841(+)